MVDYSKSNKLFQTLYRNDQYNDDDIDDDDFEDLMNIIGDDDDDLFGIEINNKKKIKDRWIHIRQSWCNHVAKLIHEGYFQNEYRMSFNSWNKLHAVLSCKLKRKQSKSRSLHPVTINIIMATGMRWLTGIPVNGVRHMFNLSRTEAYRCTNKFLNAVMTSKDLAINLPKNREEWNDVKLGFAIRSKDGVMNGCCGAIDGLFVKTIRPKYWEAHNIRAYYSGHYEHYGLNCQGVCDSNLKFLYFGVVSPGSTNDNISYTYTGSLSESVENLEMGEFLVGDAAYTTTEHLLIPFTGSQRSKPDNDAFNFYLSQLRIRIEMAFGLLVNKFRILKKPLEYHMTKNSRIIMTCARLHNFIIDNDGSRIQDDDNIGDTFPESQPSKAPKTNKKIQYKILRESYADSKQKEQSLLSNYITNNKYHQLKPTQLCSKPIEINVMLSLDIKNR